MGNKVRKINAIKQDKESKMMRTTRATIIALPLLVGSPGQASMPTDAMGESLFVDRQKDIGHGWEIVADQDLKAHSHKTTLKGTIMTPDEAVRHAKATDSKSITEEECEDDWSIVSHNDEYLSKIESTQIKKYDFETGRRIANLAYESNLDEMKQSFELEHLSDVKGFQAKTGLFSSKLSDCGFVAQDGDKFVVAIRGTVTSYDWGTNFNAKKISSPETLGIYGKVHAGFYHYAKSAFESIGADLDARLEKRKNDWVERQQSLGKTPSDLQIKNAYVEILNSVDCVVHGHSLGVLQHKF